MEQLIGSSWWNLIPKKIPEISLFEKKSGDKFHIDQVT